MSTNDYQKKYGNREKSLEIKSVTKRFGDLTAVDDVSLDIREGEIFTFLGPSGCGKTTMLRCVAGLEDVDEGEILIGGEVVNLIPPYKRNCSIVFQQLALFPHMNVFDNIAFGLVERKIAKTEIKRRVGELVDLVSLTGMEYRRPNQLSGGQQQRVALARSLVLRPKVLLLDEPLAALDRKLRKEMQTELKQIQREVGITFMNVTHDQKEALSLSDRIAVMKDGRLVQLGSPGEIYESPRTTFVADFMGASNIFQGRVVSQNGSRMELRSEDGLELVFSASEKIDSQKVKGISVHPELINIALDNSDIKPLSENGDTAFAGRIKEIFYQGDFSEVTVILKENSRELFAHLNRGVAHGINLRADQDVIVHWNWVHNNVLLG